MAEKADLPVPTYTMDEHAVPGNASDTSDDYEAYRVSWRTYIAIFSLCVVWGCTTFGITGPNFSISAMVQTFPNDSKNALWIADAPLLGTVTVPPVVGALSDRYGKKWFILVGALVAAVGAVIAGSAHNLNTIIGGQAIYGCGAGSALVSVASGMEVVPAKYRALSFGVMGLLATVLGALGGPFVFAACIKHNVGGVNGWRWGFYIEAILFLVSAVALLFLFNPPPTRFRREQSAKELIKSIDFFGLFLLCLGSALILLALIWGGQVYNWTNARVISILILGPLVLIAFGIYEWKGRKDGLLHHDFFMSRNFSILMAFGAVDGMLLYGLSQFVPNQIRSVYNETDPVTVAQIFAFDFGILPIGYFLVGLVITKLKRFRIPLIIANLLTTLFLGLLVRSNPSNLGYFKALLALLGLITAADTVVPVAGISLVVPSHLIATSNTILVVARALGGSLGLTIFNTVYNNKAKTIIPGAVIPILEKAGLPADLIPEIVGLVLQAPQALAQIPAITPQLLGEILDANAHASAKCYSYVWYSIMAAAACCFCLSFFIEDTPEHMTDLVEIALEKSHIREKQEHVA